MHSFKWILRRWQGFLKNVIWLNNSTYTSINRIHNAKCKLMGYMHKKVTPVKYQVNKYEEFSLFIIIVNELSFAGRKERICLCLIFFSFIPGTKGFFSCTILLPCNYKTHPEHQWLVTLSSLRMVSPENVSCLHFLSQEFIQQCCTHHPPP